MLVEIGSIRISIDAGPWAAERLRARYADFVVPDPGTGTRPRLRLIAPAERRARGPSGSPLVPRLELETVDEETIRVEGDCRASLDLASGRGVLESGDRFVGMDALVRLSLSLLAPEKGWVVFHGAAVELASGSWAVLLGRSGAGKSTAARAFVSYCDEMVLLRPEGRGAEAASTPFWNGRPGRARCDLVVCLERSAVPASTTLTGGDAVRALASHVVRHVARNAADRLLFERICTLAARVPVVLVRSASGEGYPASLGRALASAGFALQRDVS